MSNSQKTLLLSGASRGIGHATVKRFSAAGWRVLTISRQAFSEHCPWDGGEENHIQLDLADIDALRTGIETIKEKLDGGPLNALVNNAGISSFTPFMDISEEMIDRIMSINIKGPMLCCQEVIPDMLKTGWGRIINVSSSSAQTGAPMMCHYSASKGGVIAFTKSLGLELAAKGITVNNIPPGFIDTPMLRQSPVDIDKQIEASPMKRAGKPEDIATACAFLASEQAGYITGLTLGVNGGRVMP